MGERHSILAAKEVELELKIRRMRREKVYDAAQARSKRQAIEAVESDLAYVRNELKRRD